jgi:hypothetical protein
MSLALVASETMNLVSEELRDYQDALRNLGTDSAALAGQAEHLGGLPESELERALKAFNASADNHPYAQDSDYGALLLEALADVCSDPHRRQRIYYEAKGRAVIFASYATSGGEGLARSMDVERIARKLDRLGFE